MSAEPIPSDNPQSAGPDRMSSDGLRALMERVWRDEQARQDRATALAMLPDTTPLVLANPCENNTIWDNPALVRGVLISPSTEGSGWRISYFDDDGFSGHAVRGTKKDAILTVLRDGYTIEDQTMLRDLLRTERFREGNARTEQLQNMQARRTAGEAEPLPAATATATPSSPSRAKPHGARL